MLELFRHLVWAHKAGPYIDNALDTVFVFIRGITNLFELVERRYMYLKISAEQVSQLDMQVGCFLGFRKLLCIF